MPGFAHEITPEQGGLAQTGMLVVWKRVIASALKERTTVANRRLATTMHVGNLDEVSLKVAAWTQQPEPKLKQRLTYTPNYKA